MVRRCLLMALVLASVGCSAKTSDSQNGGRVQISPKAIAAVILDHIDESERHSSGSPAGECHFDVCTGKEPIQVMGRVDFRGGSVQVTISERGGTEWPGSFTHCDGQGYDACHEHREPSGDLLISSYALMEPEEDPGIVSEAMVLRHEIVIAQFFGPGIEKDPATLDLPVSQAQLRSIVRDPRLRLTTDRATLAAGSRLKHWRSNG